MLCCVAMLCCIALKLHLIALGYVSLFCVMRAVVPCCVALCCMVLCCMLRYDLIALSYVSLFCVMRAALCYIALCCVPLGPLDHLVTLTVGLMLSSTNSHTRKTMNQCANTAF